MNGAPDPAERHWRQVRRLDAKAEFSTVKRERAIIGHLRRIAALYAHEPERKRP